MNVIFGMLLIIIGILGIAKPEVMWFLSEGWQFKNVEPSELAIIMTRVSGIIAVLAGFFVIYQ